MTVNTDKYLTTKEAAKYLGISHRTLESWRVNGGSPKFHKLNKKMIRYKLSDLISWVNGTDRISTSDYTCDSPL